MDLDKTLAEQDDGWKGFSHIGEPIMAIVHEIRAEKASGSRIVIHTCRVTSLDNKVLPESLDAIRSWLTRHDVPYDEIWMGTGKPWGDWYVDDKAVNPDCHDCMSRLRKRK